MKLYLLSALTVFCSVVFGQGKDSTRGLEILGDAGGSGNFVHYFNQQPPTYDTLKVIALIYDPEKSFCVTWTRQAWEVGEMKTDYHPDYMVIGEEPNFHHVKYLWADKKTELKNVWMSKQINW